MFGLTTATRVFVAATPIDMRKGFDGLFGLVRDSLAQDPLSGHLFLFTNRQHTRLKALVFDGSAETGWWGGERWRSFGGRGSCPGGHTDRIG
ncbi:MAG: IS66 family insertion sequence element accessory protein TnpB [Acidobacteria bacterium]|nr:IS66 family insertion sequence element accessory protein TnpB [Acidobacteriota bacterium]